MIQHADQRRNKRSNTSFYLHCSPNMPLSRDLWWSGAFISNLIFYGRTVRPDYRTGVPISMERLKKMLGSKAQPTIQQLLNKSVIARVKGYVVGESPFFYRLVPPYDLCQRLECFDRHLIGKIVRRSQGRLPVVKWLENHARSLCIDEESALAVMPDLRPKRNEGSVEDVRECAETCVRLIADGDAVLTLDRAQGRVFAPHVTLNRKLRTYLRSPDGEQIVSLDIRNSQPLLLSLAFAQYFHQDRKRRQRLLDNRLQPQQNPYLWPGLRTIGRALGVPNSSNCNPFYFEDLQQSVHHIERVSDFHDSCPSLLLSSSPSLNLPDSCSKWTKLAESGQLYEHFDNDRERVNDEFILTLFGERPLECHDVGRKILSDFPEVAVVITAMKTRNGLVGIDDRPYRYMACLLQLYESTLMIYRVCGRIMKESPETPVWTIHDCILTTEPHKEYVERIIREEYASVGISPSIKETYL